MEKRKYCSEIAKLKTDTFGQNLVTSLRLLSPIISPKKRDVFLFKIYREILEHNLLQNCEQTLALNHLSTPFVEGWRTLGVIFMLAHIKLIEIYHSQLGAFEINKFRIDSK